MKLLVIVPVFNEQGSIERVVQDLQTHCPQYDYLVVNDGSTDDTADICAQRGFNHVNLPVNLGLSGAFQTGVRYAVRHDYDAVLQFDGDGQHMAEYISALVEKAEQGYDIVIGSRYITVKKPFTLRMFGSFLLSWAMRLVNRKAICDPTSGMRLYRRRVAEVLARKLNYPPEPDTVSLLLRCGATLAEVQVEMRERLAGHSYFNVVRSARYMVVTIVSILLLQWFRRNDLTLQGEDA